MNDPSPALTAATEAPARPIGRRARRRSGSNMVAAGEIRVGVSGWTYAPWRGDFFPPGLPRRLELPFAAAMFRTIEINGTHYSLQRPSSFARWAEATPDDFVFAVKAPRYVTHMLRLRGVEVPMANFFASGLLRLGAKLGPILWQFPPNFRFDTDRIAAFAASLPHDTDRMLAMARKHDGKGKEHVWLKTDVSLPVRHAIEIRHESFRDSAFIDLLREHRIALVCADTVKWPRLMDVTADFVYCRLHGSRELYRSGYDDADLDIWAERVRRWALGRSLQGDHAGPIKANGQQHDVFVFFDNTDKKHAPENARGLMRRLGQPVPAYERELGALIKTDS